MDVLKTHTFKPTLMIKFVHTEVKESRGSGFQLNERIYMQSHILILTQLRSYSE